MEKQTIVKIELSKEGLPCMWAVSGASSNTRGSTIIGDMNCRPKKPILVTKRGHFPYGDHALVPITINDIVVVCSQWQHDFTINIYKIVIVNLEEKEATLELLNSFDKWEWEYYLLQKYFS